MTAEISSEQRTLKRSGLIVAGLGLALALTVLGPLYPVGRLFLTLAHWPFHPAPEVAGPTVRLLIAISGGLTVGLGAMMWVVARDVLPVAPQAGRRVVIVSCLAWFCTDSTFSVLAGAPMNALLNIGFVLLMIGSVKRDGMFTPATDNVAA